MYGRVVDPRMVRAKTGARLMLALNGRSVHQKGIHSHLQSRFWSLGASIESWRGLCMHSYAMYVQARGSTDARQRRKVTRCSSAMWRFFRGDWKLSATFDPMGFTLSLMSSLLYSQSVPHLFLDAASHVMRALFTVPIACLAAPRTNLLILLRLQQMRDRVNNRPKERRFQCQISVNEMLASIMMTLAENRPSVDFIAFDCLGRLSCSDHLVRCSSCI